MQMIRLFARLSLRALLLYLLGCQGQAQESVEASSTVHPTVAVDGVYLKAFGVALVRHRSLRVLSERQKQIEGYVIRFSEDRGRVLVLFVPRISATGFAVGGETSTGRAVQYTVNKETNAVESYTFFE
jgi:hypothetical protein